MLIFKSFFKTLTSTFPASSKGLIFSRFPSFWLPSVISTIRFASSSSKSAMPALTAFSILVEVTTGIVSTPVNRLASDINCSTLASCPNATTAALLSFGSFLSASCTIWTASSLLAAKLSETSSRKTVPVFLELTLTDISAIAHIIKENRTILIPVIKHLRTLFPILKLRDVTSITAIITGISNNTTGYCTAILIKTTLPFYYKCIFYKRFL